PGVTDAVARWLPVAEGRMPAQLTDVALGVLLTQPAGTLSSERLTGLLGLARRLASPAKVEQAERLLADQAIADLMRGGAAASGVLPPEADLDRYARTRLDPANLGPGLARTLSAQPAVLRGLLGRLA